MPAETKILVLLYSSVNWEILCLPYAGFFFILVFISSGTLDIVMWQAKDLPGPVGPKYPGNTYLCSSSKIFIISLNTEKTISGLLLCVFLQRGLTMFSDRQCSSRSPQVIWEQNTYNRRKNQVKVQQYCLVLYNKATKISITYYMTVLLFYLGMHKIKKKKKK